MTRAAAFKGGRGEKGVQPVRVAGKDATSSDLSELVILYAQVG